MSLHKDPFWYKDAIIYELHVRSFYDSSGDGNGDFQGLIQKLDYLQTLGITCIWLLPFYPSPLKDDGYDISDYHGIHSNYGNLKDFKNFIKEAHRRGLRVITELVINHTSDQHPWFQAARRAKPNSARRNFYIWSDTPEKFQETRIIFSDTERSNWTWDEEAQSYYWHRFFSHQPDLNHNNPRVVKEVIKILRFWLDMGVDGLRLDAVPYLCVREGTNNENLPETHQVIKAIRKEIDLYYEDRMLLAEANQWPQDVRAYFGEGDECHMAFHFPLMPRIFMAIRKEDSFPIIDIISKTPDIPYNCQWGLFLRNHDELTLEMVTDEERDYMYKEYVTDPRMRINLGIRRRLAPLVENDPATIQMLNSILFSFPGTPILYYGDEIGMGDNIYLGDRDGVRTPMQWSIDRNAGFSKTDPAKLYNPIIMDPVYGYQAVNVEAQERNTSSLLNFMKRLISLRRQYKALGRGNIEFMQPLNRKVLVYIRRYKREVILCVVNLSRFVQPVELDLSEFKDLTPVELFGRTQFPPIGELPYFLTLGPNAFYWFKLDPPAEPIYTQRALKQTELSFKTIDLEQGWEGLWEPANRHVIETDILPAYLPHQPWFVHKESQIKTVKITDWSKIGANFYFVFVEISYENKLAAETYCLPLRISTGMTAQTIVSEIPGCILCWVKTSKGQGVLFDAVFDETACTILLSSIEDNRYYPTNLKGWVTSSSSLSPVELRKYESETLNVRQITPRERSTSIFYDEWMVLKLYRRIEAGPNPDIAMRQYLLKRGGFNQVSKITGFLEYHLPLERMPHALGILQNFVPNEGDALTFTKILLKNYLNGYVSQQVQKETTSPTFSKSLIEEVHSEIPAFILKNLEKYSAFYALLGQRTAEFHLAMSQEILDKEFITEKMTSSGFEGLSDDISRKVQITLEQVNYKLKDLSPLTQKKAHQLFASSSTLIERIYALNEIESPLVKIRCHGNLHLSSILKTEEDFLFLDFDGDLHLSISERRKKQLPLMDIASMLCSFHQASTSALMEFLQGQDETIFLAYEPWVNIWTNSISVLFLKRYLETATDCGILPKSPKDLEILLATLMQDKAFNSLGEDLEYNLENVLSSVQIILYAIQGLKF